MTTVRTYYWNDRIKGPLNVWVRRHLLKKKRAWREFGTGNAGDIFARNLVSHFYPGATAENTNTGPRLLCVGSIAHKAEAGDVLCGIGGKGVAPGEVDRESVLVHAVRGPITQDFLQKQGFDTSSIAWHGDPGLIISKLIKPREPKRGRVIFIPHYREREHVAKVLPRGIDIVEIDADPLTVGRQILSAELVFSSSLHGIVFSHALGRPVVMVKPATEEPLSKFEDYHLGVGLDMPKPLESIADADIRSAPTSPATLSVTAEDIVFPDAGLLRARGIMT